MFHAKCSHERSIGFNGNAMFLTEVYDVSAGVKGMDFYLVNGRHNVRLGGNKLLELVIVSQPHMANIQRAP